ncbi:MAG: aldo/keto reductase [Oscillospiraceae bacterium]|jgi:predicted aldo/keto reductase-like oxidoreductase|nr:aldo/keto reductase [Oscillospiraceae bacterium]
MVEYFEKESLMNYRTDKYGNKLSVLGFGCMRFPKNPDETEKLFDEALAAGINYFDTAYMYSGNEAALGRLLEKKGAREKVNVATKIPPFMCRNRADFDRIFGKQLDRLKTDYIDYYLIHMLNGPEQWRELCEAGAKEWIAEKKERGQIRQIGFSFHGEQGAFIKLIDAYDWEFCLIQYSYLDVNNQAGLKGLRHAASKGVPVFVMEPLRGGLLADKLPLEAEKIFKGVNPSASSASWALRWLWNHGEITLLLSGMKSAGQIRENAATADYAAENAFTERETDAVERVAAVFKASDRIPCTGCRYCMPCPAGVNIPECFSAYNDSRSFGKVSGIAQYIRNTGAMISKKGSAGSCVKCGKCSPRCPQGISVEAELKTVRKRMEPLWFRAGMPIVRRFTGGGRRKRGST